MEQQRLELQRAKSAQAKLNIDVEYHHEFLQNRLDHKKVQLSRILNENQQQQIKVKEIELQLGQTAREKEEVIWKIKTENSNCSIAFERRLCKLTNKKWNWLNCERNMKRKEESGK